VFDAPLRSRTGARGQAAEALRHSSAAVLMVSVAVVLAGFTVRQLVPLGSDADYVHDLLALDAAAAPSRSAPGGDPANGLIWFLVAAWAGAGAALLIHAASGLLRRRHGAVRQARTGLAMALVLGLILVLTDVLAPVGHAGAWGSPPSSGMPRSGPVGAAALAVLPALALLLLRRRRSGTPRRWGIQG
jgi:hypothetical protein